MSPWGKKILWWLVTGRQAWWKNGNSSINTWEELSSEDWIPPPHSELRIHYLETIKILPSPFSKKGYLDPWKWKENLLMEI
jgi:hypothetical protein